MIRRIITRVRFLISDLKERKKTFGRLKDDFRTWTNDYDLEYYIAATIRDYKAGHFSKYRMRTWVAAAKQVLRERNARRFSFRGFAYTIRGWLGASVLVAAIATFYLIILESAQSELHQDFMSKMHSLIEDNFQSAVFLMTFSSYFAIGAIFCVSMTILIMLIERFISAPWERRKKRVKKNDN